MVLDDLRHIVLAARDHLRPGGWLLLEHGYDQAEAVAHCWSGWLYPHQTRRDLGGNTRCTGGQTPSSA